MKDKKRNGGSPRDRCRSRSRGLKVKVREGGSSPRLRSLITSTLVAVVLVVAGTSGASAASSSSWQKELVNKGELTVATSGTAAPLTFVNSAGKLVGFWPDMAADIAKKLGLKLNLEKINFDSILPGLATHRFDLGDGGTSDTAARLASTTFTMSQPILNDGFTVVVLRHSGISTWADLKGKQLGGATGQVDYGIVDTYLTTRDWAPAAITLFPGQTEGFLGITEGRIQGFASDDNVAVYALDHSPEKAELTVIRPFISVLPEGTAFPASSPALATKVNHIIRQLLANGTVDKLAKKWYGLTLIVPSPKEKP